MVNTQAHYTKLEQLRKEKESKAVIVVQKFYRGWKGRKYYKRELAKEKQRVEFEYENLNRELKNDQQYDLKTYLAEKKRLREKMCMPQVKDTADEIAEVIGESGSLNNRATKSGAISMQLQNFFKSDKKKESHSGKDPLSLIQIFAERNGAVPTYDKKRPSGLGDKRHERSSKERRSRHRNQRK